MFALGDAASVPTSKAGSVTHFEGEVLVENVRRFLSGHTPDAFYDGHANCFIETGFSKAMLIDFNYETEPLPGHFPSSVGLPLMKESHLNHLGKLLFQWFYWHTLLPGRDIPGVHSAMPRAGKDKTALIEETKQEVPQHDHRYHRRNPGGTRRGGIPRRPVPMERGDGARTGAAERASTP